MFITAEIDFITRPITYTVRGEDGEYTFHAKAHHFKDLMELHSVAGMVLVGIDGVNGYTAPTITEPKFAHLLPSRRDIRNGAADRLVAMGDFNG